MSRLEVLDHRLPTVALVGRPNVGKSTLFNRVCGRRKAVVLDTPGVTRDRNLEQAEWGGRDFLLIDTGGYETEPRDVTFELMREQSLLAVEQADVVVVVADVKEGEHPVDRDVVEIIRRSGKPMLLAANKADNTRRWQEAFSFYSLGVEEVFPISAVNGTGVAELLDRMIELLPQASDGPAFDPGVRIAVVGKPNVGKSSLVNAMLGSERVIASELPGTTRDTIDTSFRVEGRTYTLIDTAGIRRRGRIERGIEKLSVLSAEASLQRADVALVLIDAEQGLTDQDKHVAGFAHDARCATILVVNKWDLPEKDDRTAGEFVKNLRDDMGFLNYAPVVTLSAKTGQRVHRLIPMINEVYASAGVRIDTPALNEWMQGATHHLSPPWRKGRQLRIKYVVQTGVHPPTFVFFVNDPKLVHFSYERYLHNRMRDAFGFEGTPLDFRFRPKSRKDRDDEPSE